MKAGAVLVIAGVWVLCQVLGGQALQRLSVIAGGTSTDVTNGQTGATSGSGGGGTSSTPSGGVVGHGAV